MLEIKAVSKRFPGVRALDNVSFTVRDGEIHALVGENGAGKSTLMRILSGVYTDYDGEVRWEDRPLSLTSPRDAQDHGIAIIHQELNLIPELTIAENIFLGREPRTRWGTIDRQRMASQTRALLNRLNLHESPNRPIAALRIGERQLVEVAKALSLDARLLILDEPTSALSEAEITHLFAFMSGLKAHGVTMIYISHKFDEIFRIADQVTVLRDGAFVGSEAIGDVDQRKLIAMMVGRPLSDLFPKTPTEVGDEVMRVEHLSFTPAPGEQRRSLDDISFTVRKGEIVGVAGLMGSGRTELLETIFGVYPRRRVGGRIVVRGTSRRFGGPRDALAAGIALVTEDRKNLSLITKLSVGTN
ncbi:MAG: sugar ABC transporter ATP-binding protein, partial [Chloroflexia bacterium]|nr:sugar ABC transporter ATP-binding protein [Chloroflexia bacterium]